MKKIVTSLIVLTILAFTSNAQETGTFKDKRDGKVYKTVKIGNQVWMSENLAHVPQWGNYWAYDNDNNNVATYGYLYDWYTAINICPSGWHLPSDSEWKVLTDYLGGESIAGGKLKESGTVYWDSSNTWGTNSSGFSALPGGFRYSLGYFCYLGENGNFWSSTGYIMNSAWRRSLGYDHSEVDRSYDYKGNGRSVRCVRD